MVPPIDILGDTTALVLGLLTLIAVIVLLDQFLWRPLVAWSDRFKLEPQRTKRSGRPSRSRLGGSPRHSESSSPRRGFTLSRTWC